MCYASRQDFAPDLVLGDVVYACAMGQSELLGRAQGRSPPRLPRVLVRDPRTGRAGGQEVGGAAWVAWQLGRKDGVLRECLAAAVLRAVRR